MCFYNCVSNTHQHLFWSFLLAVAVLSSTSIWPIATLLQTLKTIATTVVRHPHPFLKTLATTTITSTTVITTTTTTLNRLTASTNNNTALWTWVLRPHTPLPATPLLHHATRPTRHQHQSSTVWSTTMATTPTTIIMTTTKRKKIWTSLSTVSPVRELLDTSQFVLELWWL